MGTAKRDAGFLRHGAAVGTRDAEFGTPRKMRFATRHPDCAGVPAGESVAHAKRGHPRNELLPLPGSVRGSFYVPHAEVLKRACLLVSHA